MIEEFNQFIDLPDDPEEAFITLERRKRDELEDLWKNANDFRYEREYVITLLAYSEVHQLGFFDELGDVPRDGADFEYYFKEFEYHVQRIRQRLLVEAARKLKSGATGIVVLDTPARTAIHKFIDAIRQKLYQLELSENKRDALFAKLNAFASEVDKNRTRTEAFYAFAVDTARTAREVNDEIKPLQETIDRVFDWLDKATKWKDTLPSWQDKKKIEPPHKQISNSSDY